MRTPPQRTAARLSSSWLRALAGAALVLLAPVACVSVATFIVQQYDGEERPSDSLSILRLNPSDPVILVALDGERLNFAVTEPDTRVHIEMLPGEHVLDVGHVNDPIGVQQVRFLGEAGATYRVLVGMSPRDASAAAQGRWQAQVVLVDAESDRVLAPARAPEPPPIPDPTAPGPLHAAPAPSGSAPLTTPLSSASAIPPTIPAPIATAPTVPAPSVAAVPTGTAPAVPAPPVPAPAPAGPPSPIGGATEPLPPSASPAPTGTAGVPPAPPTAPMGSAAQ